jgi:hypothetical protein
MKGGGRGLIYGATPALDICLERLRKPTKYYQESQYCGQDLKPRLSEYEPEANTRLRRYVFRPQYLQNCE